MLLPRISLKSNTENNTSSLFRKGLMLALHLDILLHGSGDETSLSASNMSPSSKRGECAIFMSCCSREGRRVNSVADNLSTGSRSDTSLRARNVSPSDSSSWLCWPGSFIGDESACSGVSVFGAARVCLSLCFLWKRATKEARTFSSATIV